MQELIYAEFIIRIAFFDCFFFLKQFSRFQEKSCFFAKYIFAKSFKISIFHISSFFISDVRKMASMFHLCCLRMGNRDLDWCSTCNFGYGRRTQCYFFCRKMCLYLKYLYFYIRKTYIYIIIQHLSLLFFNSLSLHNFAI